MLVGTDGTKKMSQSLGNYISVRADVNDMFGKTMSIPDELMPQWFRLAAGASSEEVDSVTAAIADGSVHPGELKRDLARRVVDKYHGKGSGEDAERTFDRLFKQKQAPEDVPVTRLPDEDPVWLPKALAEAGIVASNGEARRLIEQGAVKINGERLSDESIGRSILDRSVVQVGKRRFVKFVQI